MTPKLKRIIAWIGIVFFSVFIIMFLVYLPLFFEGVNIPWIDIVMLVSLIVGGGFAAFSLVVRSRDRRKEREQKELEEFNAAKNAENREKTVTENKTVDNKGK